MLKQMILGTRQSLVTTTTRVGTDTEQPELLFRVWRPGPRNSRSRDLLIFLEGIETGTGKFGTKKFSELVSKNLVPKKSQNQFRKQMGTKKSQNRGRKKQSANKQRCSKNVEN